MASLLLGLTLTLWGLELLGVVSVGATVLGLLALITGIVYIVSSLGVAVPSLSARRREE